MIHTTLRALILLAAATLSGSVGADVVRLSEPVEQTDTFETFGAPLPQGLEPIPLAQLLERKSSYLDQPVLVRTRITKVCQVKGCFFIAQEGDHAARVSFKDYGFFVPTDISGRIVTLAGALVRQELSEAQAAHLNEDAGGGQSIQPGAQYEIVATSVRVPR